MHRTPAVTDAVQASNTETFTRELPADWFRTDTILAIVVAFVSVLSLQALRLTDIYAESDVNLAITQVFSLGISGLLVLYRRFPVAIALIFTVLVVVGTFVYAPESYSLLFVGFMTLYSVGAWVSNRRLAFWVRLAVIALQWLGSTAMVLTTGLDEALGADEVTMELTDGDVAYAIGTALVISLAYHAAAWYFGTRAFNRAKERWKLQRAHDQLAAANQKIADAAVQDERLRIARELHDVIAHHVTVMGIHASAARRLVEADRDRAAVVEQLAHIETSSAQAVTELQTMVYTLRDRHGSADPLPDLSQLPELVRQADTTTQTVSYQVTGEATEVTAATELTLYRVAQEALSNARKHAGDDVDILVALHYGQQAITLSVTDNGTAYEPMINGTGTGIQGMQERVNAVDGTLEYGPRTPYGWKVVVRVPCTAVERNILHD